MILPDVNVLLYAHRPDAPDHANYLAWLRDLMSAEEPYCVYDLVLSAVVRIVTNPGFNRPAPGQPGRPSTMTEALTFVRDVRDGGRHPLRIAPGPRHWEIFTRLCRGGAMSGPIISDVWLAALAIESGCEIRTNNTRDFQRIAQVGPALRFAHPLH